MEELDSRLVLRMMEDDSQAFDQLVKEFYPKILRMAYLIFRKLCRQPGYCTGDLCNLLDKPKEA